MESIKNKSDSNEFDVVLQKELTPYITEPKYSKMPDVNKEVSVLAEKTEYAIKFADLFSKENEEVYVPKNKNPIIIPKNKPSLKILQHARDETHRFGVAYNRTIQKDTLK